MEGSPSGGPFIGGLEGIRTLDPHNANVVRSQLRYKPVYDAKIILLRFFVVKISANFFKPHTLTIFTERMNIYTGLSFFVLTSQLFLDTIAT